MCSTTLSAGSCPPSPGFEPCAILICSSSPTAGTPGVTPNRADATCLVGAVAHCRRPVANRSGSSPPSPLLLRAAEPVHRARRARDAPPGPSAPTDIAEAKNRRQMASTGSTSSIGNRRLPARTPADRGPRSAGGRGPARRSVRRRPALPCVAGLVELLGPGPGCCAWYSPSRRKPWSAGMRQRRRRRRAARLRDATRRSRRRSPRASATGDRRRCPGSIARRARGPAR